AGVAFLVRYAGVSLLATGIVVLVLAGGRSALPARARARAQAVFLTTALPLVVAVVVRNAGSGAPFLLGPRIPDPHSPLVIADRFVVAFGQVFLPGSSPTAARVAAVAIAALFSWSATRSRRLHRSAARSPARSLLVPLTFVLVYGALITVSGKIAG